MEGTDKKNLSGKCLTNVFSLSEFGIGKKGANENKRVPIKVIS